MQGVEVVYVVESLRLESRVRRMMIFGLINYIVQLIKIDPTSVLAEWFFRENGMFDVKPDNFLVHCRSCTKLLEKRKLCPLFATPSFGDTALN
jgi:hypothetical protein